MPPDGTSDGKSVVTLLKEAYVLYRMHARALLLTCAVLFVPASIAKSCAQAAILAPTLAATIYKEQTDALGQRAAAEARAAHQQRLKDGKLDPGTVTEFNRQNQRALEQLTEGAAAASGALLGDVALFFLRLLSTLVTAFFLYGIVVPLTNGALTIAVADRILGGNATWMQSWMLMLRRLWPLLTALIPGALLVGLGFVCFVVPGMVLAFLFVFTAPVVLIEGIGGVAALRRSADLVKKDWLRVAVVMIVFGVIRWLAQVLAQVFIPRSALFFESLFGDLFTMVLMPIPVLGSVLLYLDLRRTQEGFNQDRLRADLAALKMPTPTPTPTPTG